MKGLLLDGICIRGLGGDQADAPLTAALLEEMIETSPCTMPSPKQGGDKTRRTEGKRQGGGSKEAADDDCTKLVMRYVDITGDVQSVALLFCHAAHLPHPPRKLCQYFRLYAALLARWQMFDAREKLHTLMIARLPKDQQRVAKCALLCCYFCGGELTGPQTTPVSQDKSFADDIIARRCPKKDCGKTVPSCTVCLKPIFVVRSSLESDQKTAIPTTLHVDQWAAWCQICHHGGHLVHLEEWFDKHNVCPVAGCHCQCGQF